MEGSGSTANEITCKRDGEQVRVMVVASGNSVEIGGWTFKKDQLLLAMGVKPQTGQEK